MWWKATKTDSSVPLTERTAYVLFSVTYATLGTYRTETLAPLLPHLTALLWIAFVELIWMPFGQGSLQR